jgi:CBS domain-containing protein
MADLQVVARADTVADVMTTWVITVTPTDSLLKARDLMTKNRVSQLVVVDQRSRPIGFISKRDIARFLLEDVTTRPLDDIVVSETSSDSIRTLEPSLLVFNAARLFDTENLTYTIVTNDSPIAGIMTETDLCHYFAQKFPGRFKVKEFLTRDFVFAKSDYPIVHVAHGILYRQPSVPVIDEELVGIVTLSDLLSIRDKALSHRILALGSRTGNDEALITTKDLMTKNPVTTGEETDLAQAARIIINKGIGSIPVIDREASVIGLLTKHDIVRALGRIGRNLAPEP